VSGALKDAAKQEILAELAWTTPELAALASLRGSTVWQALEKVFARMQTQSVAILTRDDTPHDVSQVHRGRIQALADVAAVVEIEAQTALDKRDQRGGGDERGKK
jgi:hypothetical protein